MTGLSRNAAGAGRAGNLLGRVVSGNLSEAVTIYAHSLTD